MRSTRVDDRGDSTAPDPMPRLRRRFFASLVLIGFLVGLMLGRLDTPEPVRLQRIEPTEDGLRLVFDGEPEVRQQQDVDGAFALLLAAEASGRSGELQLAGMPVRWRLQPGETGLLLHFVATRPLQGRWRLEGDRDQALRVALIPKS